MTSPIPTDTVYLDTETGGLRPADRPWEIALVKDYEDGRHEQYVFHVADFDPSQADPMALQMNGFYDRFPTMMPDPLDVTLSLYDHGTPFDKENPVQVHHMFAPECLVAANVRAITHRSLVVACNPVFDVPRLEAMLNRHSLAWTGHYKAICAEDYAAGAVGLPAGTRNSEIGAALGVERDAYGTVHSGLADTLYARGLHRAAIARGKENDDNAVDWLNVRAVRSNIAGMLDNSSGDSIVLEILRELDAALRAAGVDA